MIRLRMKDLALVAFAGGLLAVEVAGLRASAPTVLRTLAGVPGVQKVQAASRGARAATSSVLDGVGVAAAEAASGVVKRATGSAGATPTFVYASPEGACTGAVNCPRCKGAMMGVAAEQRAVARALRLAAARQRECARIRVVVQSEGRRIRSEIRGTGQSVSHSTSESVTESGAESTAETSVKTSF